MPVSYYQLSEFMREGDAFPAGTVHFDAREFENVGMLDLFLVLNHGY